MVLRSSAVDLSEGEDIPETTHPVAETGDHGRRPKLPSEPQTGMATNEIVVTTREFELPVQSPVPGVLVHRIFWFTVPTIKF